MKSKQLIKVAIAAAFACGTSLSWGATATQNLGVSATVSKNCTISTAPVAFGSYDPVSANLATALTGSGSVTVRCTKNASTVTIALGTGLNGARNMVTSPAVDNLPYELYQPDSVATGGCTGLTTTWTTAAGAVTPAAFTGAAQTITVCGKIAANQQVSAGSYADTVVATVNF